MANLQRFRVVNFDETVNENEAAKKTTGNLCSQPLQYKDKTGSHNEVTKIDIPTKQRYKTESSKVAKKINFKSTSELFRSCRNNNTLRNLSTKTFSSNDIRRKLHNTHGKKTRQKVNKNRLENNCNEKRNNFCYTNRNESQDDIKVLYTSERCKNQKRIRDFTMFPKDPDVIKSASQIFRTNSSISRRNTFLCYRTCKNIGLFPIPKRKKKKSESKTYILRTVSPLCIKSSKSKSSIFRKKSRPDHFSLVGFPMCSKSPNETLNMSQEIFWKHETLPIRTMNYKGDIGVGNIIIEPVQSKICSVSKEKICTAEVNVSNQICCKKDEDQDDALNKFFDILRSALMYTLVALIIVVWLPCIIIGVFCWLIVSLLRPEEMEKSQHLSELHNVPCKKRDKFKYRFYRLNRWIADNARQFAVMVRDFLKSNEIENTVCCHPQFHQVSIPTMPCQVSRIRRKKLPKNRNKWQPNPNKRYFLYYNQGRGWLIKPVRNQICEHCDQPQTVELSMTNFNGEGDKKPSKRDRTVTFWDSQDNDACKCDHAPTQIIVKIDECTQVTCKDPETNLPTCRICPEDIILPRNMLPRNKPPRKYKPKPLVIPCPTERPCPGRKRKLLRLQQARDLEAIKKLSPSQQSEHASSPRPIIINPDGIVAPKTGTYRKLEDDDLDGPTTHLSTGKKISRYFKKCFRDFNDTVNASEEVWGEDGVQCGNLYLSTLKKRPCYWIHRHCPNMYPLFLAWHKVFSNCCHGCMFVVAACIWCPLFFCGYLCFTLICMSCGGGCECNAC